MAGGDSRTGARSRLIGVLKIALPLVAIGLLSTVFLFQEGDAPPSGITFSEADRDTMRDGLTVYDPKFAGVSRGGDRFYLEAAKATPDTGAAPSEVSLVDLEGRTEYLSGLTIHLSAARGRADLTSQEVTLSGGIRLSSSTGYEALTGGGTAGLETGTFVSDGPVTLTGPIGTLEAGMMRLENEQDDTQTQNQVFRFENGVKLTIVSN